MLEITLKDDKGLVLISDDADAENARVQDCFMKEDEESGEEEWFVPFEVYRAWQEAEFTDKLEVDYAPEYTKEILYALAADFPQADEVLNELESQS
jgi:hypothetical protein